VQHRVLITVQNLPVPSYAVVSTVELYKYHPYAPGGSEASFIAEYADSFLATARLTLKARRRGRFAVVHARNPPDIFWPIALVLRWADRTKFVFDHHDLCPELFQSRFPDGPKLPYRGLRALGRRTQRTENELAWSHQERAYLSIYQRMTEEAGS
jgi:hypothetical protein